ncbi:S41 family peptidase [Variovorax boronicumulans]|uniref:S41 family peptidase n=1 Tax=Variovorax boronicumulans TaxID=436515 RepID=UPI0033964351
MPSNFGNLLLFWLRAILAIGTFVFAGAARAQTDGPSVPINASVIRDIAVGAAAAVEQNYVFADRAADIAKHIRGKESSGGYASIRTAQELRLQLETDLRSVNGDKHLMVLFSPIPSAGLAPSSPSTKVTEEERRYYSYANSGFVKAERLEGNIGYLDIRGFSKPEALQDVAAAAFGFVADTAALVIDMRHNGGGWPAGVAWVTSYLFRDRVHLNDLLHRKNNRIEAFWTTPGVPGRKFTERPVYVLTSKDTFSGGEEFAYNLQALKRATVIGEVTGGGAHPVKPFRLSEHFEVLVPFARAVNPITKDNWESRGVQPDIAVPADAALNRAYLAALQAARAAELDPVLVADQDRAITAARLAASNAGKK